MPRALKPCVGCSKAVRPNFAHTVPRCKACANKQRESAVPQSAEASRILDEQADHLKLGAKRTLAPARGGLKVMMIPDLQVGPGTPTEHLDWIAAYAVDKRPDAIVQIGDFADMSSLSSYDRGKRVFEGRRIRHDIDSVLRAQERLLSPIRKCKGYSPRLVLTLGNHEYRIQRAVDEDARLEGILSIDDLRFSSYGWEVYPFLTPVRIEGVEFCHYYTSGVKKNAIGTAAKILAARHGSAIAGHAQGFDIAVHPKTGHIAIISGAAYIHDEDYLGPQDNSQKRQIVMLHELKDGLFDPMFVSLAYLEKRFKGRK